MSRIPNKKTPVQQIIVDSDDDTRRIDNFLMSRLKGLPRTRIYQMLRRGEVRVNKGRVKQTYRLQKGDVVRIPPVSLCVEYEHGKPPAYMIDMVQDSVLYEDEHIIALNKPSGIVVHSGSGRSLGVIEVLRYLRPEEKNLQLAHRIDQATSGCLLVTKTASGLRQIHTALRNGQLKKRYRALLKGDIGSEAVTIKVPIKKNAIRSGERLVKVNSEGQYAESEFVRTQLFQDTCLVDVTIKTGRTHQIRVHAQYMEHAIAGDTKYGDQNLNKVLRSSGLKRLFLHASQLKLIEYGDKGLSINAPLSTDLSSFLKSHI
jgi:23S rRNA pseudouridine955/2504/2580 synthase